MQLIVKYCVVLILVALPLAAQSALAGKQDVSALRSAYLFYFSHFIEWPTPYVFENKTFNLCVLSSNAQDMFQLSTLEGKQTGSNQLHIIDAKKAFLVSAEKTEPGPRCHMFYLAEGADISAEGAGIIDYTLLITEGDNVSTRGDIHLYSKDNKLKFEINKAVLDSKDFVVSSKLMRLSQKESQ